MGKTRATAMQFEVISDFRRDGKIALWTASCIAACVLLVGWGIGSDAFVRVFTGFPAMVPTTAACIIVSAVGSLPSRWSRGQRWPLVCGLLIGVLVFLEMFTDFGSWLYGDSEDMAWATAIAALLSALALVAQSDRAPRLIGLTTHIDTIGLCLTAIPLIGYLLNSEALWDNIVYARTSLHTALAFALLFSGRLMIRADQNWAGVLYARERGSQMGRLVLPFVIFGPIALCYVALIATQRDIITADFRLILFSFLIVAISTFAVVTIADRINRLEISARAQAEEIRRRDVAFVRAQKIAVLGRLAGGVAHDFNNLLTVIKGNLELLDEVDDPEQRKDFMADAHKAAENAAALTRQLLTYGRKSNLNPEAIEVGETVSQTLRMFKRITAKSLDMVFNDSQAGTWIFVDRPNFQQVLLNIMINASDAIENGGTVEITTGMTRQVPTPDIVTHDEGPLPVRDYITVSIRDTGHGMTQDTLERVFEPYFTTKDVGAGSGLGLSMAKGFCRQSDGDLRIQSTSGEGTTVTMFLPAVAEQAATDDSEDIVLDPPGSNAQRVLIVDDQVDVLKVVSTRLTRAGYSVEIAENARSALALLDRGPEPHLVITDLIMPGDMQGDLLAAHIYDNWPDIKIIVLSGFQSDDMRERLASLEPQVAFMQKPVGRDELLKVIADTLRAK